MEPLSFRVEVPCNQKKAFDVFVADMPRWWPLDKRAMSMYATGQPARTIEIEGKLGGQIVEIGADDSRHHWGTFTAYDPYGYIAMDFHMGLPPKQAGMVEVRFTEIAAGRTLVELTHSKWENYGDMAETMINGYGSSWPMLFEQCYGQACGA